jgi:hypothetical protein
VSKPRSEIAALRPATALTGAEPVPVLQSGSTKRTTAQQIADLASSGAAVATVQQITTSDVPLVLTEPYADIYEVTPGVIGGTQYIWLSNIVTDALLLSGKTIAFYVVADVDASVLILGDGGAVLTALGGLGEVIFTTDEFGVDLPPFSLASLRKFKWVYGTLNARWTIAPLEDDKSGEDNTRERLPAVIVSSIPIPVVNQPDQTAGWATSDNTTNDYASGAPVVIACEWTFSSFANVAGSETQNMMRTRPEAGRVLQAVSVDVTEAFAGGTIATCTVEIGIGGDADKFLVATDAMTLGKTFSAYSGGSYVFDGATDLKITVTCTGDTLDQLTQGIVIARSLQFNM